jgi:hypothetical protein
MCVWSINNPKPSAANAQAEVYIVICNGEALLIEPPEALINFTPGDEARRCDTCHILRYRHPAMIARLSSRQALMDVGGYTANSQHDARMLHRIVAVV